MIHVVTIGIGKSARDYAIDLWWQVPKGGMASAKIMRTHARARAREREAGDPEHPYNVVALRRHQFGLGCMDGQIRKLPSLAAALNPNVLSFVGVFCFGGTEDEGVWWLCAIREGSVAGDGDRVYPSLSAAREGVRKLLNYMGTSGVSQVEKTTPEESLAYIAPLLRPDARLEALFPDVAARARLRRAIAFGLFIAVAGYAGFFWWERREEQQEILAFQAEQARLRKAGQLMRESAAEQFPRPWLTAADNRAMLADCIKSAGEQPLSINGWELAETVCGQNAVTVKYAHRPGASYVNLPDFLTLAGNGTDTAERRIPIAPGKRRDQPELMKVSSVKRALYQLAQDYSLRVRDNWKPQASKVVKKTEIKAPWQAGRFELHNVPLGCLLSGELGTRLELPGCIVESVLFEPGKNATIKGAVHAYP